jgi:hypothetical protein
MAIAAAQSLAGLSDTTTGEVPILMLDDVEKINAAGGEDEPEEEILEPSSKYERIMIAALEATRLNEEIRRKGTKLQHKVTTEAIKRVLEGKVKAVILPKIVIDEEQAPAPQPPSSRDALFGTPPPEAESPEEDASDGDDKAKKD